MVNHFFSLKNEIFFLKFPNPRVYPALKECKSARELYNSWDDNHDMKKAREILIKHIGKHPHLISPINLFKIGVPDYQHGFVELSDDIVSRLVRIDLIRMLF